MESDGENGTAAAVKLRVEVERLIYTSPDREFAVVECYDDQGRGHVLVGALGYLHSGEQIEVEGELADHPRYGLQIKVRRVFHPRPASKEGVIAALAAVRHIGPQGAAFLYSRYGERTLDAVEADPQRVLGEIPGLGRRRLPEAVASWQEQREERELRVFLAQADLDAATAARIRRAWGKRPLGELLANPYALLELPGVGFLTADRLGRAVGIPASDPRRLAAAILYALSQAELDGHCYLPRPRLERDACSLLEKDGAGVGGQLVGETVEKLVGEGRLVVEQDGNGEDAVYEAGMYRTEVALAEAVVSLATATPCLEGAGPPRPVGDFTPSEEQWEAIQRAFDHRLSLLTGGPGTGKTACMLAAVALVKERGGRVRLCAPTGKAARRLATATGEEATTVHRLLGWQPTWTFERNENNPLKGIDLLIVDEASMLSLRLAKALFAAVGEGCHVLLVGDSDQLPAVGPGRVLEDLIASGVVPLTRLTKVFRQASRSLIVRAAHAINAGKLPRQPTADEELVKDFFFIKRPDELSLQEELLGLVCQRLPASMGLDPLREILVLSPWHRGEIGIDRLNELLRSLLNPHGEPLPIGQLHVGDRVIQTRNDYEHDLMNGETAILQAFDREQGEAVLELEGGRRLTLPEEALATFEPAYAISIHKAQGSQAPAVVVAISRSQRIMLNRNLLYTAVTRAERLCLLLAEPGALELALRRRESRRRFARLAERVTALAGRLHQPA